MLGRDAGKHVNVVNTLLQRWVVQRVQFGAGHYLAVLVQQADFLGDGARGIGIVARDHARADAGVAGHFDGCRDFGAGRVDHAGQADKDQIVLQRFRR